MYGIVDGIELGFQLQYWNINDQPRKCLLISSPNFNIIGQMYLRRIILRSSKVYINIYICRLS